MIENRLKTSAFHYRFIISKLRVSRQRTSLTGMHIIYYNSRPTATLTNENIAGRAADQQEIGPVPFTTKPFGRRYRGSQKIEKAGPRPVGWGRD